MNTCTCTQYYINIHSKYSRPNGPGIAFHLIITIHFCCSELKIGRHKEKLLFIKRTCSQLAPQSVSGILVLHFSHLSLQSCSSKYRLSNSGSSASYSFKSLTTFFKLPSHFTNSGGTSLNRPLILSLEFQYYLIASPLHHRMVPQWQFCCFLLCFLPVDLICAAAYQRFEVVSLPLQCFL